MSPRHIHRAAPLAAALLAGCSLAPAYHEPAAPVAAQYPLTGVDNVQGPAAADIGWHDFLRDPLLQELVTKALANNRDLRTSALNVESAQATYEQQHAALFPAINGTAGISDSRTPHDIEPLGTGAYYQHVYSLGGAVTSWEVDLFGKLRNEAAQDREAVQSQKETLRAAKLSLVAQIADQYLTVLADQELLDLTLRTVKSNQSSLHLTQLTLQQGTGTALDTAQAESLVRQAEAGQAQYTRQLQQDIDELVLLIGAPLTADETAQIKAHGGLGSVQPVADVPAGLPSELLTRRPDILAAEHTLKGANANIGAARAAFFPDITITASGGTESASINRLFGGSQADWAFSPQITIPIFDEGRNQAALDLAKIQNRSDITAYEKAIQTAFREVSDALSGRATYNQQLIAQQQLVDAERRDYDLSTMRFKSGIDNFLTTLVAERSLYSAQIDLVGVHLAQLESRITIYKVLGGGWKD